MKNINQFLRGDTKESMMRLMSIRVVNCACFVAILATVASFIIIILLIVQNKQNESVISGVNSLLGSAALLSGALLVPAFGGKVGQSFIENKKEDEGK